MKAIWIESSKEDLIKAKKKFDIGDFKTVCLLSRKSACKSLISVIYNETKTKERKLEDVFKIFTEKTGKGEDIEEMVDFLSRYTLEEDITSPLLAAHWNGLPTKEEAEKALKYAEKILNYVEELDG
ncbi:MAG TPA: HEPN domain-containing protein [candidate division WOR-3 bacterium]|uniref:HEPN domain-containing protein n=1 Tax=candidate division WOR-3 bacterium TaxID=2052148 RepID=A0A7C5I4T6_UNCW3|nr:HEPN domain-containing protein [candidate division WOR-3 bacterium]